MSDKKACGEFIARTIGASSGSPSSLCARPAKFVCEIEAPIRLSCFRQEPYKEYRCGIHAKRHKILEAYKP